MPDRRTRLPMESERVQSEPAGPRVPLEDRPAPLVSIVMPVFNGERYIRASLESVLAQTYPNLEILVMDDASTDRTPEILDEYNGRIVRHRQRVNRGIYGNMNDGIALARGRYIAIYHSDDVYEPEIVAREVEFLESWPQAGAVFCADVFMDQDGREKGRLELPREVRGGQSLAYPAILNALLLYKNRILRCPSCMVPATVYRDVGTYRDRQFKNTSDLEMYLRIARKYPIGILEQHLFRYRWGHGNSGQRYRHLRTDPERFFAIMDLYLGEGDCRLARPEALAAYESHRAEDHLMQSVNLYILGQVEEARRRLRQVRARVLAGSPKVQRVRLLTLYICLQLLLHLPRIAWMANLFYRNWHDKQSPKPFVWYLWHNPVRAVSRGEFEA